MECEQIRERIKRVRRAKNYSQKFMAESLQMSSNSYREIETGTTKLINSRLYKIAEILDLSMENLIFGYVTQDEYVQAIKKLEREHTIKIENLIVDHKIEIAKLEGKVTELQGKIDTREKIIGVLQEKRTNY